MSDQAHREEYALTASLLPHVLAVRVSYPDDPENPAPGVVGELVRDGELWRVYGVPSPGMPLSQAVLSLVMRHRPGRAGTQSMALADRALSAYLTANPALNYTEAHVVDGYPVTLTRPGGSKYFRLFVTGSHDAYFEDLGTARGAIPSEVKNAKLEHQSHLAPEAPQLAARPEFTGHVGPPDPQEMAAAYRTVHGTQVPWLTLKAWEAGQLSTAAGTVRTAPWYLAATAAKRDGQPMSAVPRYMAAARMDATAGRLRDHRDPLDPSGAALDAAGALGDAAAAMRADDLTEARSAITRARSAIPPGSSLHRILDQHETPVINLASPTHGSGPAARRTRRPSQPAPRQPRGRA